MKKELKQNLSVEITATKIRIAKLQKDIAAAATSEIKTVMEKELERMQIQYAELVEEFEELQNQKRQSLKTELQSIIHPALNVKQYHLAYIATDAKYIFIKNYSNTEQSVNLVIQYLTWENLIGVLNSLAGKSGHFDIMQKNELRAAFETAGASYFIRTSSFNAPKWDPKYVFNILNVQRQYWAPVTNGTNYNGFFDDLLYSLCGGRPENICHMEQWIAYKYLYPEKVSTIPNINITGTPGGNGKGLLAKILATIFTVMGVTVMRGKNLTGGFNSIMEGKVITILDDERKERFPQDELKQNSGNGSIVIEPKGVDAYSVDATANTIVLDNTGLVRLVGGGSGGEDRRWSIIRTELTLLEVLAEKYDLEPDQCKQLAEEMAKIFEDRIECGRWVAALIDRHHTRSATVLLPLHGADYAARLDEQKDNWISVFEQILPVLANQGVMPFKFIKEIVEAETGETVKKAQTLSAKFDEFLSRKGYKNVEKTNVNIRITYGLAISGKFKGTIRRVNPDANSFDYELISTRPWTKSESITKSTLQLHDFADDVDNLDNSADAKIKVARSLGSYPDENSNEINDLQTSASATLDQPRSLGSYPTDPTLQQLQQLDQLRRRLQ